ncbi:glucosamine-6-phosphate deaminase [Enterobacillus tribolii]|uniref:Glucosamine-6-phosphate deaminase n=1 Tax=Enterobacillus tribolii TaxID=1487935 RepID=A0A370QP09_9GAMM|nr:glucosamine-6-phosphate deaminase [Enterobacillus tribolii]MBW7981877.1 glucosamine-6-phosphate deaminase [Enterobacillus tribolii]RDK90104.1 glucosamine-6-phosphate deaminase [Enterobacillus tribolii]
MNVIISENKEILGVKAAQAGILAMQNALEQKSRIAIILATGASQFEMLENLIKGDIDWSRVTIFHLDEYIGLSEGHRASFRRYLHERVVDKLPSLYRFVGVNGSAENIEQEIARLSSLISEQDIDVCFAGIGENGHLAFNDPPADFTTTAPYLKVELDEACRQQQLGEKWFNTLAEVPTQAISMSIHQIMLARKLILSIPDRRKAQAVKQALEGPVVNTLPASVVQHHPDCQVFLDHESASLISER